MAEDNPLINPYPLPKQMARPTLPLLRMLLLALLGLSLLWFTSPSPASSNQPVLGHKSYGPPPFGKGYGAVRPKIVSHGGAQSGYFFGVRWQRWGAPIAIGTGRGYWYKPGGGYYERPIRIRLRAKRLERCGVGGRLAYSVLQIKRQKRPDGGFFPWSSGLSICS